MSKNWLWPMSHNQLWTGKTYEQNYTLKAIETEIYKILINDLLVTGAEINQLNVRYKNLYSILQMPRVALKRNLR